MSRRPAFSFYPADWRNNANLRRCSWGARGVLIDVMGLMHDSDEYGVLRWPLKEIAHSVGAPLPLVQELARYSVIKGRDSGQCEGYVYRPRSGRKEGPPVTLLAAQPGPIWFSSRMLRDEHVRVSAGASTRFGTPPGKVTTPTHSPSRAPARRQGEDQGEAPSREDRNATERRTQPGPQDPLVSQHSADDVAGDLSISEQTKHASPTRRQGERQGEDQGDGSSSSSSILKNPTIPPSPKPPTNSARWGLAVKAAMSETWPDDMRVAMLPTGLTDQWRADGYDLELDVLPTVRQLCADKRDGEPPGALNYFTKAIARRHQERRAASVTDAKELEARRQLWNRYGRWNDDWGPQPPTRPINYLPVQP